MNTKKQSTFHEYQLRINRVIDYINEHISDDISPQKLASVAPFSLHHFHRIFQGMTNETVSSFIKRVRLDKAANCILHDKTISITDLAMKYNFSTPANFTRAFKEQFGITPSRFQSGKKTKEKKHKHRKKNPIEWNVTTRYIEKMTIAYKRYTGPYNHRIVTVYNDLYKWAHPRGLLTEEAVLVGIAHDNPHLTEKTKCRYDAGVVLKYNSSYNDISVQEIDAALCACLEYDGPGGKLDRAYDYLYAEWLPQSGYQPDDASVFTLHPYNIFQSIRFGRFTGSICLPVKPL